jgi:hypothetical protein
MKKRVGLVDLCTSHPANWVPIFRDLGYDVAACWDSGDTRPAGFAEQFAREFNVPFAAANPRDLIGKIDVAVVHSANWDKHVQLTELFLDAGLAVLVDKPIVGNRKDANRMLAWAKQGKRISGGSSLRFARETQDYLAMPVSERGTPHTVFAGCGVDDFNYGIHAYALVAGLLGPGIRSVRYLGTSAQKHIRLTWNDGRTAFLSVGNVTNWLPFHFSAVTEKGVRQVITDNTHLYRPLIEAVMPYLAGDVQAPPVTMEALLEPELAALAARASWQAGGAEVFMTDLRQDDPGFDGHQFTEEYRRARLSA